MRKYRDTTSAQVRRYRMLGRLDTKSYGKSLGKPWSTLYWKVYRSMRRDLHTTKEWTQEVELLCQSLCYSFVQWRRSVIEGSSGIKWQDQAHWHQLLQRVIDMQDKARSKATASHIATQVMEVIDTHIQEEQLKKVIVKDIRKRLDNV